MHKIVTSTMQNMPHCLLSIFYVVFFIENRQSGVFLITTTLKIKLNTLTKAHRADTLNNQQVWYPCISFHATMCYETLMFQRSVSNQIQIDLTCCFLRRTKPLEWLCIMYDTTESWLEKAFYYLHAMQL